MKFPWRIIGHERILERLEEEFEKNAISQVYLFCGPKEIGKFEIAKRFAMLLQCEHKNFCRNCDACQRIKNARHSDTTLVDKLWIKEKEENLEVIAEYSNFDQSHRKKTGKRTNQIGVEDAIEFTKSLWQKTESSYKICIIRDAERMTEGAMNTMLKILEEPPGNTIFLLTATHKESLLPTIVSRTRVIEMSLVPNSVLRKTLAEEKSDISEEAQQKIITLAQGRPLRALKLVHDTEFVHSQDTLFEKFARILQQKNMKDLFAEATFLAKPENEKDLLEFLESFLHFLRTLLREKIFERSLLLGKQYTAKEIIALIEKTEITKKRLQANVNRRFAIENLLLSV